MKTRPTLAQQRSARWTVSAWRWVAAPLAICWLAASLATGAHAADVSSATQPAGAPSAAATPEDGHGYAINQFEIAYQQAHLGLPTVERLLQVEVELGQAADGYVGPRPGLPVARFRLGDAPTQPLHQYYASALLAIDQQLVRYFNQQGLIGIFVSQDPKDIDPAQQNDVRPPERKAMRIVLLVGTVKELRTLASGERFPAGERLNNPAQAWILADSPLKPESMGGAPGGDLLDKGALDEYIYYLNRRPSRRVDVAMAAAQEAGGVALDYLVAEAKPWSVYAQVSNTGTEQTDEWRERLGLIYNDLFRHEDVLSLDFVTAAFDESNAALGAYEAPIPGTRRLRWKVYGLWNQFTASDVGITTQEFTGDEYSLGGELIANILQYHELFIDAVGGVRYKHVKVTNETALTEGEGDFWLPYLGARLERATDESATNAAATLIFGSTADVTTRSTTSGDGRDSADGLGRLETDDSWIVLQAQASESFYLEPLIFGHDRERFKTLAHEVALSGRVQWAFNNRLIPQEQDVAGGLYTVRGYPESIVAGDSVVIGSAEYRFHLPRALGIQSDPNKTPLFKEPFRWSPQQPYGRPDWDLVFKGFIDAGRVVQSDKLAFEQDNTLVGTGIGMELSFKQNMTLRVDWGIALKEIADEVSAGSNRVHVVFTILY